MGFDADPRFYAGASRRGLNQNCHVADKRQKLFRAFFQTKRSCCGIDSSVVGCAFDINSKFEEHPVLRIFDGIFHDIDRDVPAPLFHVQKPT